MKKYITLFLVVIGIAECFGQDLNGIWISNDDHIRKSSQVVNRADGGILLDFDSKTIRTLLVDKKEKITFNRKQTKFKLGGVKGKLKVLKKNHNQLILEGKKKLYVFEKLDMSHQIDMSEKDLTDFLISQQCGPVQGIKAQFTKEQYDIDKNQSKPHIRNQFINFDEPSYGYWYFKKVNGNAFFILSAGKSKPENILQVLSISVNGMKLLSLQEDNWVCKLNSVLCFNSSGASPRGIGV